MTLVCTNPNSCHPYLLFFGLTYILLFLALIAIPTFFDRSRRFRRVRGRRLDTLPKHRVEPVPVLGGKHMDLEGGEGGGKGTEWVEDLDLEAGRGREGGVEFGAVKFGDEVAV